jgi:hypothetical protein
MKKLKICKINFQETNPHNFMCMCVLKYSYTLEKGLEK